LVLVRAQRAPVVATPLSQQTDIIKGVIEAK